MARAPRPGFYDQQRTPNSRATPQAARVDTSSGLNTIGAALAGAGRSLVNAAANEVDIEIEQRRREEDDARVTVARSMASVRSQAAEMRRRVFEEAEDGWRGATDGAAAGFKDIADAAMGQARTPAAQHFMGLALGEFQAALMDDVAGEEQTARRAWRVDGVNSAIDTASSVLAADPNQYESARGQQIELIETMTDLSADQRRDLVTRAEEQFAVSAMGGLVERDPQGALTLLRDPEAEAYGVSRLTGPQRTMFENRALAEINRRVAQAEARASEARASLRDAVSAQTQLLQRGIVPQQPIDPGQIASLLGPDVAQAYIANLAGAASAQSMAGMSSAQVAQIAAGAVTGEGSDMERLLTSEARSAASSVLEARRQDPGGYALQNGQMRHGDLMGVIGEALSSGDWSSADEALRDRGADALELRRRGVTDRVAVLSRGESEAMSAWLGEQSAQNRLAFFSRAQQAMNPESYTALMGQISPEGAGPVTAFAGYLYGQRHANGDGRTIARTLLRGQEVLHGGAPGQDGRRTAIIDMPAENELRRVWTERVGSAYEGSPAAQEQAYQAFRAYYAGLAEAAGDASGAINGDNARRAVAVATGGVAPWNGRNTLLPWGMTVSEFERGVRDGFNRWSFLRQEDPRDYELRALGGGRYQVLEGDQPLRNPVSGAPVEIEVRRSRIDQ